ncbi:MAG TPA: cyclic nucleotide-binding domain-containing protein [bacterium]|nr:cyclic nucleotide-binding domain-containing protein [bacterium]
MAGHAEQLKKVPLFEGVSDADLRRIADSAKERRFDAGTTIVSVGEPGHGFYLIIDGRAEVKRGDRTIATLGPGEYFGELALIRETPRTATVVAKDPTTCLALTRWDFKGIVVSNPSIAIRLLETVANRLQDDDGTR